METQGEVTCLRVCAATDIGRWRDQNEDGYCVEELPGLPGCWLLAVADGIGGNQAGEVASQIALTELRSEMALVTRVDQLDQALASGLRRANRRILEQSRRHAQLAGMGTTLTAAVLYEDRLWVGHVGDSRAYRIREGRIVQLTEDHSLVGELVKSGSLSEAEAMVHPQKHLIIRALGIQDEVEFDLFEDKLGPGDVLILATDGLTDLVASQELSEAVTQAEEFAVLAENLVQVANQRGGQDNITVILAQRENEEVGA